MKKLFTTILMMGVALVGWASVTKTLSGDVLTINYVSDPSAPSELSSLSLTDDEKAATTIVLTGDWSNKDLVTIGSLVGECTNNVYLDLSACDKFESRISYTGEGNPNWVTNDFEILPNGTSTVTVPVTVTDAFNPVTVVNKPVTVTVEGDELIFTHSKASHEDRTVYNIQNVGDVTDLPEEFMTNPDITKRYSYPGIWGDSNSYLAYDESDEKWYAYAWSSKLLVSKNIKTIYSYEDENGDTQTQDNTNGLTQYGDDWYYDCYTYKDSGEKLNDLNGVIQVGDKWYKATSTTYAFEDENGDPCSQSDPNNPKSLTKNADGTYSYIRYIYTDNNGQQQVQASTDGLQQDGDSWLYPLGKRYTYTYNGVTSAVDGNQCTENDGTYTYTFAPAVFSFAGSNFSNNRDKLSGISFPNNANFDAIPAGMFSEADNLTDVVFGDYIKWIGKLAFNKCTSLNDVTFPQTLKVIGVDAFYKCTNFTTVDLRIRDLVKVDAAAFNMENDYEGELGENTTFLNKLTTVYLPETDNTTLEFFGNQVFSSSLITELDFSHCLGIKHFGYDGKSYFGESAPSSVTKPTATFLWHRFLTRIKFPPNLLHVGDECFNVCPSLQEAVFTGEAVYDSDCNLTNPLTIGQMAFKNTPAEGSGLSYSAFTSVTFSNNVTVIGSQAFCDTQLTEVILPASIEEVGYQAFACADPGTIKKVVFEEIDHTKYGTCNHAATVIKAEAFNHQTVISDVYVNTVVDITCENWGFDHNITFAQGDATGAATGKAATLHFPAGHEAHYTNLEHYLTNEIASDAGLFQAWLTEHFAKAQNHETGFGWHEFVNTGSTNTENPDPGIDPDPENPDNLPLLLRTFSDPQYARIVPDGLRAYVVNNVTKNGTKYELTLQRIPVIPAQTGVILFGQPNSKTDAGKYILAMSAVGYEEGHGQPYRRDYWDVLPTKVTEEQGKKGITVPDCIRLKNYLMPIIAGAKIRTADVPGEISGNDVIETKDLLTVYPYEPYKTGEPVQWRNFALNRMSETEHLQSKFDFTAASDNFAGFFRILPGTYSSGYAYLHLSAVADATTGQVVEYDDPTGAECVVKVDSKYYEETNTSGTYDPRQNPKLKWWKGDNVWENMINGWGVRKAKFDTPNAVTYLGELEDTDGVVKLVIPENKMDEVFSITGMKVSNPSKGGIYIKNGKKIIVK